MNPAIPIALALFACSCANQKWARYDSSQFSVIMEPTEESVTSHVELLSSWSESKDGLPPGVSLELAYYLALLGQTEEAEAVFSKEVAAHPNVAKFAAALQRISMPDPSSDQEQEEMAEPITEPDSESQEDNIEA